MATELQRQALSHKKKQERVQSLEYGAASIFLGAKEAAAIDVSAVHEAALQALRDLSQYDSRFGLFESSVLHSSSIGLQRELKTREENEAIDVEIGNLIPLLALWAHENRSHLVLEYLLRRYRVHEFNVDILLGSFLILHDTKVFAKIVQQCRLTDTPWAFLVGVKSTGVAPPRAFFVEWSLRSNWFLQVFVSTCSRSLSFLGIRKPHYYPEECGSSSFQGGSRMMAMTTAVLMEAAEKAAFSDEMMRSVYPFLLEGLKCKVRTDNLPEKNQLILEWKCASCMILSQLCRKTVFGEKLSKMISKGIAGAIIAVGRNEEHRAISHMLFSLAIILAQHQQLIVIPKLIVALLAGMSVEDLNSQLSGAFQAQYLLTFHNDGVAPLISTLVSAITNLVFSPQGDNSNQGETEQANPLLYLELLHTLIQHQRLSDQQVSSLITKVLHSVMSTDTFAHIEPQLFEVTALLANFYSKAFGLALRAAFNDQSRAEGQVILRQFLLKATQNQQVSSENGSVEDSLFFALNSPIKEMRIKALEAYRELPLLSSNSTVTPDQRGLAEMVINNMQDLDADVAIAAWNAETLNKVMQAKSVQSVGAVVEQVWQFWLSEKKSCAGSTLQLRIVRSISESSIETSSKMFVAITAIYAMESTIELQQLAFRLLASSLSPSPLPSARKSNEQPPVQAIQFIFKKVRDDVEEGEKLLKVIVSGPSQASFEYTKAIGRFSVLLVKLFSEENTFHTLPQSIVEILVTVIIQSLRLRSDGQPQSLTIFSEAEMVPNLVIKAISSTKESSFMQQCLKPINSSRDNALNMMIEVIRASFQEQELSTQIFCQFDNSLLATIFSRLAFAEYESGNRDVRVQVAALSLLKSLLAVIGTSDNDVILSIAFCALSTCSSTLSFVRKHSVCLLEAIYSTLEQQSAIGKKGSKAALKALLSAIIKRADLIVLEADAIRMVITEFLSSPSTQKEVTSSLIQSLSEAAMLIDVTDRHFADFLLSLLPTASSQVFLWSLYFRLLRERTENVTSANSRGCEEILLKMVTCLDQVDDENDRNQFFGWVIKQIESDRLLNRFILSTFLPMIPKVVMTSAVKEAIFRALIQRYLRSNGGSDELVLTAMKSLQVDPTLALNMLRDAVELGEDFDAVIRIRKNSIVDEDEIDAMDVEGEEKAIKDDPVAAKLLRMVSLTEIALPLTMDENMALQNLSIALRLAFMVLEKLSQPGALKVLSIEFFKGVIMESIFSLLTFVNRQVDGGLEALLSARFAPATATKGKGNIRSRKTIADEPTLPGYSRDRVGADIHAVVTCLSSVRSSSMHHAAVETMRMLIASEESGKEALITSIGQILSSITGSLLISKGKLLTHLLQLILPNEEGVTISKEAISVTQNMICKLLAYIPNMSLAQKWSLLRSITKTRVNGELLNALVIHSLLVMTSVSYQNDQAKHKQVVVESISLSRAAQRRAQRVNQSSEYEEYFMLAQQFLLEQSPLVIVHTLNKVLTAAEILVFHSLSISPEAEEEREIAPLDLSASFQTFAELRNIGSLSNEESLSVAASLAILHQEYVREVLLQKSFHRMLASEKAAPPLLIELAESCLTLCIHCDEASKAPFVENQQQQISLLLENEVHVISLRSFADITGKLTLNILGEMQVLLDGPSFLTIIQELLDHEIVAIRQKAVLFLKERLQGLLGNRSVKGKAQDDLFLELFERLSDIFLRSCEKATASADQIHIQSLVMAQSVLLSLDVMILHLGTRTTWQTAVTKILENYLQFIPKLSAFASSSKISNGTAESRKLLGSILLSCSSICTALKAAILPSLPQIMSSAMSLLKDEIELWRSSTAATRAVLDSDRRGHSLFVRSLLAAFSVIVSSLPSFCHSYLSSLLPLLLDCQVGLRPGSSADRDLKGVAEDAETCLQTISDDIPPRLSLPVLCDILVVTVEIRSIAASVRFAVLVTDVLKKADRITSLSNQVKLVSAFQYLFTLREQRAMEFPTAALLTANAECIAEFCMKLTENELKSFILRLMEWNAAEDVHNDQSKRLRTVNFLATIRLLLERFQTLFYSSIALTWTSMIENDLTQSRQGLLAIVDEVSARDGGKKRKRLTEAFTIMDESEQFAVTTIVEGLEHILVIIRLLSESASFIDETRYDSAYPTILSLLHLRGVFAMDDDYFAFNSEFVYPAIAGMCQAVAKDLLWKPLNHQLLLITRSNVTVVRIAAVDLLKFMFESLGEEYLAVLPECLPFLSELLEDENQQVSKHTRAVVTVIEELSGENLDTYLQT